MKNNKIEIIKKLVKQKMKNDTAHDFSHVLRVYKLSEKIGKKENADLSILLPSSLLHDLKNSKKNIFQRKKSSEETFVLSKKILKKLKFPSDKIEKILYCISVHSFSKSIKPKTLEAKILQDADRIDALGAIGIARVFAVGENLKKPFYDLNEPFTKKRILNDNKNSIDHFYVKLLKLKNKINTKTAKKVAIQRHEFLKMFLKQFKKEI